jgi:hypothetical protein
MGILIALVRWMIAIPAGLLFALCALGNWSLLIGLIIGRLKSTSLILPFFGPAFGLIFVFAVPIPGVVRYWWVVPLVEPTWILGAWILLALGIMRLRRARDA